MNFKLRLQNKTTLVALITAIIALVYQCLGIFEVVPAISQEQIIQALGFFINILVMLGIVVDPTTEGFYDSAQAMTYNSPRSDDEDEVQGKHVKVD